MMLTQKETTLLKDLKGQEQLCVDKYERYASQACHGDLKDLFLNLKRTEQQHLNTVTDILSGRMPGTESSSQSENQQMWESWSENESYDEKDKKADKYLCTDALAGEKHVSSVYNTSIFEFRDTKLRDTLNHIQKEEQTHGERIYQYMEKNEMYDQ